MELTREELITILGWARAVDGEWGLHSGEKRVFERIRTVVEPTPEPPKMVSMEVTESESLILRAMRKQLEEPTW